tara:strand:+ start:61 stop:312 length:252 start_codon:yes stop_codon:yes gene_type:complete
MNKTNIFNDIELIFRDVFDNKNLTINESTNSDDIEEWDSLNHINLIVAIERKFKIKFKLGELQNLKNVGEMINLLIKKYDENK